MKCNKTRGFCVFGVILIAAVATGCSGINASKSISPLDFLLPGLMDNRPSLPVIPIQTNSVPLLAEADQSLAQ